MLNQDTARYHHPWSVLLTAFRLSRFDPVILLCSPGLVGDYPRGRDPSVCDALSKVLRWRFGHLEV
jgi:hypothetical protein